METGLRQPADYERYILTFHKPGMGQHACVNEYDSEKAAKLYEDCAVYLAYQGPRYTADMVSALVENKEKAVILDIAAGTGLVGEQLHGHGFRNLHAHDGANNMLETCKEKGVYSKFICCFVGDGLELPVPDNSYDAVTCSGGTCENHLPPSAQAEFVRVLKPGGYFVNSFRSTVPDLDYGREWESEAKGLEQEGKWTRYGRLHFPNYNLYSDGVVDIYRAT